MALNTREIQPNRMIVIFITLALSKSVCSSGSGSKTTNVAVWFRSPISRNSQLAVDSLVTRLNSRYNTSFAVRILSLDFSVNKVLHVFRSLENYSTHDVQFVATTLGIKETWFLSKLLCNRDTMIIDIRNPGIPEETEPQSFMRNFLTLVPPKAEKKRLLQGMIDYMLCKKTITLTCLRPLNDQSILRKQLQKAKDEMIFCILLECSTNFDSIFATAKHYDLLGKQYRWFSSHYFEDLGQFRNLPLNIISITMTKFDDSEQEKTADVNIHLLSDALTLFAEVNKHNKSGFDNYPTMRKFLETKISGETGLVHFSKDQHFRQGSSYDVYQLIRFPNTTGWLKIGMWRNNSFDTSLMAWIVKEVSRTTPPLLRISTKKSKPWMFFAPEQGIDEESSQCLVGMKCINYTTYYSEKNNSFVEHCCSGMLVDLLQELMKRTSFTPRLQFVRDKKFGSLDPKTNQWNGMIGEVLRNEADTALYSLTITERRARAVSFSHPIIAAGSGILISVEKETTYATINNAFLRPFKTDLWVATIALLAACVITLWTAERLDQQQPYNMLLGNRRKLRIYTFTESMSYGWGVFVQKVIQEGGPKTLGGRLVAGTFGFYMIIVFSSYTANLAAIKVVEEEKTEIADIYDDKFVHPTNDFKFTSSKFTATSDFFKLSPDPRLNKIYNVMKDRLVSTRAQALKLLKSGEIQAFFEDTPSLHYMASQQEKCDLKVVGKSFGNSGYGMPFRPNSTWERVISASLRELHTDGVITELSKKWLEFSCVSKTSSNIASEIRLTDLSGILFWLAVFCVGSFMLLAMEYVFKRVFSNLCYTHARSFSYDLTVVPRNTKESS